ncbi:bifunctional pyr operon transcriptional regulator/uracil phosphoribosyltransferase [Lamprobacter modestohalophilus]|uniref:Bifunctional pyr operon transcriptional regulator/uracil phosphoribosyltransferase n=1 Tax=Lamprobacter modestohalophilus TaxID=1064514 RepID=A0A9X0W7I9_9GAMM|nr:bifunctional pyr operon transcriptional regulator/uracil phosphoribosyltransferase [Lamprobacter modestohalophilus]
MTSMQTWQSADEVDNAIGKMADQLGALLAARAIDHPLMVGIHSGGVWVAERLHQRLGLQEPMGQLDISFYRDDFTRIGTHPQVRPSDLPVPVDDRHIVLVDDVLQTGRTIRAALNVLFDYGRPASVVLAILAGRDGRELPIEPDVVGLYAELEPGEQIKLTGPEPLTLKRGRVDPDSHQDGAAFDADPTARSGLDPSDQANSHTSGQASGQANGHSSAQANSDSNSHANDDGNGHANGHSSGAG